MLYCNTLHYLGYDCFQSAVGMWDLNGKLWPMHDTSFYQWCVACQTGFPDVRGQVHASNQARTRSRKEYTKRILSTTLLRRSCVAKTGSVMMTHCATGPHYHWCLQMAVLKAQVGSGGKWSTALHVGSSWQNVASMKIFEHCLYCSLHNIFHNVKATREQFASARLSLMGM